MSLRDTTKTIHHFYINCSLTQNSKTYSNVGIAGCKDSITCTGFPDAVPTINMSLISQ